MSYCIDKKSKKHCETCEECAHKDDDSSISESVARRPTEDLRQPNNEGGTDGTAKCLSRLFLFDIILQATIEVAYLFPDVGARYLAPDITTSWIAPILLFVGSGLSLPIASLQGIFERPRFDVLVQLCHVLGIPLATFTTSRVLEGLNVLDRDIADGLLLASLLPMSAHATAQLVSIAGGHEHVADSHSTFSNVVGLVLTPALVALYVGVAFPKVFWTSVTVKILLPFLAGWSLQSIQFVVDAVRRRKAWVTMLQRACLVWMVYTSFCQFFWEQEQIRRAASMREQYEDNDSPENDEARQREEADNNDDQAAYVLVSHLLSEQLLPLVATVLCLHVFLVTAVHAFFDLYYCGYEREHVVVAVLSSFSRTVTYGIPIVAVLLFHSDSADDSTDEEYDEGQAAEPQDARSDESQGMSAISRCILRLVPLLVWHAMHKVIGLFSIPLLQAPPPSSAEPLMASVSISPMAMVIQASTTNWEEADRDDHDDSTASTVTDIQIISSQSSPSRTRGVECFGT